MNSEIRPWNFRIARDLIKLNYGKSLREDRRRMGPYPVYGSNGIIGFHDTYLVEGPGIILGRKGNVGSVRFSNDNFWPIDTTYYLTMRGESDFRFWYYLLQTLQLDEMNTHSAVPGLNRENVYNLEIAVPGYREQMVISGILSKLDAKIELNNQMNKTLESIAQAIFKHWFIDFEFPDENGQPYMSSGGEMVESEIGETPSKWETKSIDEIANFLNGLPLQKYPPEEGKDTLPVIKIREMNNGVTASTDRASSEVPVEYIVENGDVLFSWSGSLGIVIWGSGKGALNQHLFKVTSNKYPKWFYYYWLQHYLRRFIGIAKDKATTMGHIQRHHLSESIVAVPDLATFQSMDKVLSPILDRIIKTIVENNVLANIRDSLLPRLISGKIRVPLEDKNV